MNYEHIVDGILKQIIGEIVMANGSISDEEVYIAKLLANRIKVELLQLK